MPSRNLSVARGLAARAGSIAHDRATSVQNRMALTENAFHSDVACGPPSGPRERGVLWQT
jgi:hypothetical protein